MSGTQNSFWGNIFRRCPDETKAECDLLREIPVFREMDGRELMQIDRLLHRREYHENEVIFMEGDPGLGMYIIEEGTVEIVCGPSRRCLAELGQGEFFGELSLLDDSSRTASALARTPCRLLSFFQPDLYDLLDRKPKLGVKLLLNLARVIGERLRRSNEAVQDSHENGLQ